MRVGKKVLFFSHFNELRKNNVMRHFWKSYLVVLFLPIIILFAGVISEIAAVSEDVAKSNRSKLEHSVQLLDKNIELLETLAGQGVSASEILRLISHEETNQENILSVNEGVKRFSAIFNHQSSGLMYKAYLYYNNSRSALFNESYYQEKFFVGYLKEWNMSYEEWQENLVSEEIDRLSYVYCGDALHLVMPMNVKSGKNSGTLVIMLDSSRIEEYFSFANEYGDCELYIKDANGRLLFTTSDTKTEPALTKSNKVLYAVSDNRGWEYFLVLPRNIIADRLMLLYMGAIVGMLITILVGIRLSMHQAVKFGKPIDNLFEIVGNEDKSNNLDYLGEIVSNTLKSNQELQEELEQSKPLFQKVFFHDLITLDVTNNRELTYLAENAGIKVKGRYRIAAVRLFKNNDFYDADEQTLYDVRVIITSMQRFMEEHISESLLFYQRNYLSLLMVFEEEKLEKMQHGIEVTWKWLRDTFSTESSWGISSVCDDVMNLWRYCEEAELACSHCEANQFLVEYSAALENQEDYYFPEIAQEKLINGMKASNLEGITNVLQILKKENFVNRHLNRKNLIKLNFKVVEILAEFEQQTPEIIDYIMKLNALVQTKEEFSAQSYFATIEQACGILCRNVKKEKGIQRKQLIDDIQEYIEENYANPDLGLATISIAFKISEGYISMLFKEQTEINFAEYVESIRMNKACKLLKESNKNIGEIAELVGYNSLHSFRRAFKRVYHVNPKDFR